MKNIRIATLGAATFDVFLIGKALQAKRDVRTHDYVEQFPLGAKVELDGVVYSTGGGATNAAVTFARQGFHSAVMAKIGDDLPGREVLQTLANEKVATNSVAVDLDGATGYSTILLASSGERTVLVYRGSSEDLKTDDFNFRDLSADWLYITSVAGNLALLEAAVRAAHGNGIKVAIDPGSRELKQADRLRKLLPHLTLVKGNREEMAQLFATAEPQQLIRAAAGKLPYIVISDGARGSWASDGRQLYRAGMYKDVKVIDRTGAGDAFGSGLVAMLANGKSMIEALSFGSANASSVVRYVGAKAGILHQRSKISSMKIEASNL